VAATGGAQGVVAQQHPAAGTQAPHGALVRLVVR
jgi:beta-lactam-binding protein with PASTA domain